MKIDLKSNVWYNTSNRTVMFRVWDSKEKYWLDTNDGKTFVSKDTLHIYALEYFTNFIEFDKYRFFYQEYAGVKDKNGKEVYEGDILKDFEFPVTFRDGCFFVGIAYDLTEIPLYDLDMKEVEVVGNVFELR